MNEEQPKKEIPEVWQLPDPPPHPELMVGAVVRPDNIRGGMYLLIASSSAVKLAWGPGGPSVERVMKDPTEGGVILVMAYCYPFIAGKIMTGENASRKMCIDIRRHDMISVDSKFVRAILPTPRKKKKKQEVEGGVMDLGELARIFQAAPPVNARSPSPGQIADDLAQDGWVFNDPEPEEDPDDE